MQCSDGVSFPQWRIVQIIMIQKRGKSAELAESYRSISLLPIETIWEIFTPNVLHNNREA